MREILCSVCPEGGDLGYSFLTLVELNFEHWTNKQKTGRKRTERESSLSRVSGNMPKEQQASIYYTGGTLLHLPSSPS
jgi:hypothetical protein